MKNTPLTEKHIALGAKMAEFAGYNMPISYAGQLDKLRKSVMNLQLPDYQSSSFFDNQVKIVDLASQNPPSSHKEVLPNVRPARRNSSKLGAFL